MPVISAATKVTGIIGWPVAHSLSPLMHNAAFAALGLDLVYLPFAVEEGRLKEAVAGLAALGVVGFNVTIPHKVAILPFLQEIDPQAAAIGAVNTVLGREGRLVGYNTDGIGLLAALREEFSFEPEGQSVIVLGAGGAARSAVAALGMAGAAEIGVVNRSVEKGEGLVAEFRAHLPGVRLSCHGLERLSDPGFFADRGLVVNTTSVGMHGTSFPGLALAGLPSRGAVFDMVYAPLTTPLMIEARRLGLAAANGIGMLVAQGEAAFAIWTGQAPPAGCMKRAVLTELGNGNP